MSDYPAIIYTVEQWRERQRDDHPQPTFDYRARRWQWFDDGRFPEVVEGVELDTPLQDP